MAFNPFKKMWGKEAAENTTDFIEIDLEEERSDSKVLIKTFVLKAYDDINGILNALREGYTIAVIDIRPLKAKDVIELKRAVSKVKKTVEALEGKIAGFGENIVIATPSKVFEIQKGMSESAAAESGRSSEEIERF